MVSRHVEGACVQLHHSKKYSFIDKNVSLLCEFEHTTLLHQLTKPGFLSAMSKSTYVSIWSTSDHSQLSRLKQYFAILLSIEKFQVKITRPTGLFLNSVHFDDNKKS